MTSKLLIVATAAGCIAAAGFGSYVAVRSAATDVGAPAVSAAPSDAAAPIALAESRQAAAPLPARAPARRTPPASSAARTNDAPRRLAPEPAPAVTPAPVAVADTLPAPVPQPAFDITDDPVLTDALPPSTSEVSLSTPWEPEALEVPAQAVLGIRLDTPVSSEGSRVEDRVSARLMRDVTVGGRTVIPEGTEVVGYVSLVERGGRLRERARVGIRFTAIVLPDNTRIPIDTPPVVRDGGSKAGESTAKVGASAVIGGILGGIVGGKRGAAIGGAAGAAGGTAAVMAGDRSEAALAAGSTLTLRLNKAIVVPADREPADLR